MTRKHNAPRRANHQKRANIAVRTARKVRRLFRRMQLAWIGMQERSACDHFSDLVSMHEAIPGEIRNTQHELLSLAARRRLIEWELA